LKAGDVLNGEFTLTNHGLVRADNLKVNIPGDDAYIRYELLAPIPESLGAKERITVPYRMTCIQSLVQDEVISGGAGSGCYQSCFTTSYEGVSSNGCPYKGAVPHCFFHPCGGGSSSSGGGSGWGWQWTPTGPSSTGGGGGYVPPPTGISSTGSPCTPAPDEEETSRCGGGGGQCPKESEQAVCETVGSAVHLYMRAFTDEITDLSVKVPGGTIDITRSFYNDGYRFYRDAWHWKHTRKLEFDVKVYDVAFMSTEDLAKRSAVNPTDTAIRESDGTLTALKPIRREGVWYRPDPNKSVIDLAAGEEAILRPKKGTGRIVYKGNDRWLWEDIDGEWEEYYYPVVSLKGVWGKNTCGVDDLCYSGTTSAPVQGKLAAYGDRQGAVAKLIYDADTLSGITDRNDRQVLWLDYSTSDEKRKVIGIRDIDHRRIEYEVTHAAGGSRYCYTVPQTLIYRFTDAAQHDTIYTYGDIKPFKWSGRASTTAGSSTSGYSTSGSGGGGGSSSIACTPPPRLGLTSVTDALGRKKSITYDGDGAVSSVLDDEGKGYHFQFSYDTKTREYYAQVRDTNGLVKEVWIDTGSEATRVDINGRTVKTFAKDGATYTITDENGNRTQKTYDQWDHLVKVVYPDGAEVKYEYDPDLQKVLKKIDENQVVTRYY
ncbi:MAG: hypothetical protein WAU91_21290, partial [Desulfatitalea sp.]